jgi:lysophospholipase L1-like esterase
MFLFNLNLLVGTTCLNAASLERHFDFGDGAVTENGLRVNADTVYSNDRGYGFEPGALVSATHRSTGGPENDFCTSDKPFFFSVDLPEGNYRIALALGDPAGESHTVVKAESRRLVIEPVDTTKGQIKTVTFLVNIRNAQLPGGGQVQLKPRERGALHWDNRFTLEFNGRRPCVASLELTKVEDAITLFLAGDSTVTDQQIEPWAAWGQMLPAFFDSTVAIANHAESGETIKSFVGEHRFEKVMSLIKAGDYLFIQFGHNDQKINAEHTDAASGFKDYLRRFIAETKARNALPVLVTSMERRNFDPAGHIIPSLEKYPQAMRDVGAELNIPVVDLNAMSVHFYEALGPEAAKKAFVYFPANSFPGQSKALADDTHFSSYGAYELARCVVEGIKDRVPALATHLRPDSKSFDPMHPDLFAKWQLPASPPKSVIKPEGS